MLIGKRWETWNWLTIEQVKAVVEFAQARGPGLYTLKEIHGDQWQFVLRRQRLGRLFKLAVDACVVPGIRWVARKSNKSHVYEVSAIQMMAA